MYSFFFSFGQYRLLWDYFLRFHCNQQLTLLFFWPLRCVAMVSKLFLRDQLRMNSEFDGLLVLHTSVHENQVSEFHTWQRRATCVLNIYIFFWFKMSYSIRHTGILQWYPWRCHWNHAHGIRLFYSCNKFLLYCMIY